MHFVDIANRIIETKFDTKRVNLQAVHNELIRCSDFVLIGRGIYALKEWGYQSGTVMDVIESILKERGEMDQEDIVKSVLERRQVKRITILLALKDSTKFVRTGRKRYKTA
jgi:Holliday junction resolvasome RuvABC DNA-binding subunit